MKKLKLEGILREQQKSFINYTMENLDNYLISEMPTAFGKTITLLALASKLVKKKKIVLVTANNLLARDMYNESLKYEETKDLTSLVLGKDNYVDIDKIKLFDIYYNSKKALAYAKEKIDQDGYLLIEDFIKDMDIVDDNIASFLKYSLRKENGRDIEMGDTAISITNYAYFLSLFLYAKREKDEDGVLTKKLKIDPNDYYFLFDEVHEISNAAEMILSSSFSPFKLYLYTKTLMKDLQDKTFVGSKSLMRELKKYEFKARLVYEELKNENKINEYEISNTGLINKNIFAVKTALIENELIISIQKRLNKYLKKNNLLSARMFLKELREGSLIVHSTDTILYYSKSKGYINFYTYSKDIKFSMALDFWKYLNSFIGVTATAIISENTTGIKSFYSYERLGINLYDIKNKNGDILAKGNLEKCLPIQYFAGILSPSQAKYYITDEDYIEDDNERADWIADEVAKNFNNKNSIVLVGGYQEAELIYEALKNKIEDAAVSIIRAKRAKKATVTLEEFKNKGGIAVLTRNFATGTNLKGELLEKLFIVKLPYPVFTNKKWLDLKSKKAKVYWYEYTNEMIISFRQAIGRLIRDKQDRGDIYILDAKLKKRPENVKQKIKYFLEKVAK